MPPLLWLLTHANEPRRATNTGHHVQATPGVGSRTIVCRRAVPEPELLAAIARGGIALAWPMSTPPPRVTTEPAPTVPTVGVVMLDGTWQEARKIYNRSP